MTRSEMVLAAVETVAELQHEDDLDAAEHRIGRFDHLYYVERQVDLYGSVRGTKVA